ncbi:hypothetical protein NIE88_18695 [Sporolactobacillus shoreicorticis]|uniref:DnaD domain-containing protein n=1 Tax=Sporolactobacillus shoreicorticis TaxID=1923877 RepID=A0ABW5S691_9BACL|nr:hypothetical protein [Sporolactobacillus shoreicorticis]MCO7127778.1 hypothetical protein [Sporolactobacillus shoreicorticis]
MRDGSFLEIKPGQHLTSIRNIAKGVGYYEQSVFHEPSTKTIRHILEWLEKQGMISKNNGKGNRQYTLISLLQWEKYQSNEEKGNSKDTAGKQQVPINKNDQEGLKKDITTTAADNSVRDGEDDGLPRTESAQPAQNELSGRGQISQSSKKALLDYYVHLRGNGFGWSPKDLNAAEEILVKVPLEKAMQWLEEVFRDYRPKHSRDQINTLDYCVGGIFDRYVAEQEKTNKPKQQRKRMTNGRYYGQHQHQEIVPEWMNKPQQDKPPEDPEEAKRRAEYLEKYLSEI